MMKKLIVAVILAFTLLLSGCSCTPTEDLNFSNPWGKDANDKEITPTMETAVYDITFKDTAGSGNYTYSQPDNLKNKFKLELEGGKGSYVTSLEITEIDNITVDGKKIESEIMKKFAGEADKQVVKYTTSAKLKGAYTYNGKKVTDIDDEITTESFFLKYNRSFAPIYSRKFFKSTTIQIANATTANYQEVRFVVTTLYNEDEYTMKTYVDQTKQTDNKLIPAETAFDFYKNKPDQAPYEEKTYEYEFRKSIDNSALLLSLRGFDIEKESSKTLSVVDKAFGEAQKINVKNYMPNKEKIKLNGKDSTIPINCYAFGISANNTGRQSLAYVQSGKSIEGEPVADTSLLVKYIEPLTEYGAYTCIGALEFTLTTITTII